MGSEPESVRGLWPANWRFHNGDRALFFEALHDDPIKLTTQPGGQLPWIAHAYRREVFYTIGGRETCTRLEGTSS